MVRVVVHHAPPLPPRKQAVLSIPVPVAMHGESSTIPAVVQGIAQRVNLDL